jgi:F0F1-type ATP synthase alpha subunit
MELKSIVDPLGNILLASKKQHFLKNINNNLPKFLYDFQEKSFTYKHPTLTSNSIFIKKNIFSMYIESKAIGIIGRQSVNMPVLSGLKIIDSLIPIGRGQRELIIGDRQTGKTTIALDLIQNQKNKGEIDGSKIFSIYVSIGQKISSILQSYSYAISFNFKNYFFLVAPAGFPAPLQYLAPYSGCTIGE